MRLTDLTRNFLGFEYDCLLPCSNVLRLLISFLLISLLEHWLESNYRVTGVVETHSLLFADKLRQRVLVRVRQLILSEDFVTADGGKENEVQHGRRLNLLIKFELILLLLLLIHN